MDSRQWPLEKIYPGFTVFRKRQPLLYSALGYSGENYI